MKNLLLLFIFIFLCRADYDVCNITTACRLTSKSINLDLFISLLPQFNHSLFEDGNTTNKVL